MKHENRYSSSGTETLVDRLLDETDDIDWEQGVSKILPAVYDDLRRVASNRLRDERAVGRFQTTELVHEAFLRLVTNKGVGWRNRRYFFGAAATAMHRILIDNARRIHSLKREVRHEEHSLEELSIEALDGDLFIAFDEALARLAKSKPVHAEIVKLRVFAGLSRDETAETLQLAKNTVSNHWTYARAWLLREIGPADED